MILPQDINFTKMILYKLSFYLHAKIFSNVINAFITAELDLLIKGSNDK